MPFTICFSTEPFAYVPKPYEPERPGWGKKPHDCAGCDKCTYHDCRLRRDKTLIQKCYARMDSHGFVIDKRPHITVEGREYRYDLELTTDGRRIWKLGDVNSWGFHSYWNVRKTFTTSGRAKVSQQDTTTKDSPVSVVENCKRKDPINSYKNYHRRTNEYTIKYKKARDAKNLYKTVFSDSEASEYEY